MSKTEISESSVRLNGRLEYRYYGPGKKNAECFGVHANGKVAFKYPVRDGGFQGLCRTWYENGNLENEENYINGIKHGAKRLWSETGVLVKMAWYLKGTRMPDRLAVLMDRGEVRATHIIEERNALVRRLCMEEYGYGWFLSQLEHVIIDREEDEELVLVNLHPDDEVLCLVKVKCPSTDAFYTLRVPPEMKTVRGAVAWTFGVNERNYNPEIET